MRLQSLVTFGAIALLALAMQPFETTEAGARDKRDYRSARKAKPVKTRRRPAVRRVDPDCTYFDNGVATEKLDFRNPCDAEEFWRRNGDTAGGFED